jgi:hypothetical protein
MDGRPPCQPPEEVQLAQSIWDFKAKTKADGTLDKRFVRCAARGDLMKSEVSNTNGRANTAIYSTQCGISCYHGIVF